MELFLTEWAFSYRSPSMRISYASYANCSLPANGDELSEVLHDATNLHPQNGVIVLGGISNGVGGLSTRYGLWWRVSEIYSQIDLGIWPYYNKISVPLATFSVIWFLPFFSKKATRTTDAFFRKIYPLIEKISIQRNDAPFSASRRRSSPWR